MTKTTTLIFSLLFCSAGFGADKVGVLILAHGGSRSWDAQVKQLAQDLSEAEQRPVEVAFGMAHPSSIQKGLKRLEKKKVQGAIVIPLFVSSHSDIMRHNRYILGLSAVPEPGYEAKQVETSFPIVLTEALNDSQEVGEVLTERARSLSQNPSQETVLLVGHGPVDDADEMLWRSDMNRLAEEVKSAGGFHEVLALTMRDDAQPEIVAQAAKELQNTVQARSQKGPVLVVPLLISKGGVEHKIVQRLGNANYRFTAEGLLPHPKILEWARRRIQEYKEEITYDRSKSAGL